MDFDSKNLTIARGKILFAKFKPGTMIPGPYLELGNCPEFTFSRNEEFLEHYSSQRGLRNRDKRISLSADLTATVTCDDVSDRNLAFWFMSNVNTITQTSLSGQVETFDDTEPGGIYQLGQTDARPGGFRKVTGVVVTDGATPTPVTYVSGEDYMVDAETGLLTIMEGGDIALGDEIEVTYDVTAATFTRITSGSQGVEGAMKFVSFAAEGPDRDITIPRISIEPNGDLALLSDPESPNFLTIPLTFTALQKGTLPLALIDGRPAV